MVIFVRIFHSFIHLTIRTLNQQSSVIKNRKGPILALFQPYKINMNNRCLLCAQRAVTACCFVCREKDRSTIFKTFLTSIGNASIASNYYDQMKVICQKIETLKWLFTPIQFAPVIYFDPNVHKMDQKAAVYLRKASLDVQKMVPVEVIADGNCLYNSIICLSGSMVLTPSELRVRILIELLKNEVSYTNRFSNLIGPLNQVIKNIVHNFSFSELYEVAALSNVLKCNVRCIYPIIDYRPDLSVMNSTFEYIQGSASSKTICIFWTHTESENYVRSVNAGNWSPNHFVPLLLPSDYSHNQNEFVQPKITGTGSTPTKSTMKNNIPVQVRTPDFNIEDEQIQSSHSSLTANAKTIEATTTPRTKRRLQLMQLTSSMENANIENRQMQVHDRMTNNQIEAASEEAERKRALARERSAARRAARTPEEIERERTLNRERNATRRATLTSEQAEQQRHLARERSADRRATMTPEQAERQRALARERSAARRSVISQEETEKQRALARERSAARRAIAPLEEAKRQQTLNRERNASRRSAMSPEEAEKERALARERITTKRGTLTEKERDAQRALAAERIMAARATASPKVAEEQRALGRKRSATRRANSTVEEKEKDREQARRRRRLQNQSKKNKMSTQNERLGVPTVEWPKTVDIEHKTSCLRKFIQQMSMTSLEEDVCGICNVRCSKRDLRCLPLDKVPSIELLKTHEGLHNTITDIQRMKNMNLKNNANSSQEYGVTIPNDTTDNNMDSPSYKSSFTIINNTVLYEKGLRRDIDKRKRFLIHCNVCTDCWSSLSKEKIPKFSVANKVWIGDIPKELQGLTIPEQRLIAMYRHNSCIVKLQSPFQSSVTAQSAIKGNCISFPQDVVNIASTLPLEIEELCESLKIIFIGCHTPQRHQLKHILTVRKTKVYNALQWLKRNNPLYHSIEINRSLIDKLPEDDVPECLWTTMQISTDVEAAENERSSYTPAPRYNISNSNNSATVPLLPSAVLDVNGTRVSSDDITQHVLDQMKEKPADKTSEVCDNNIQKDTIYMIPHGTKPANEYANPNLLLGIFPTLFPYGFGALEDSSRPVKIDFREHIRYLLSFADHRFEEHHSFIFVVFNILQRRAACIHARLVTSRPYFQKSAQFLESLSSKDITQALVNISKGTYRKVSDEKIGTLMKHIKVVGGHVMGSAHMRSTLRTKIHSLCFSIGLPSLFVTINPADIHSPVALYFAGVDLDLDKVLPETMGTSYERAKTIASHPVATAKYFHCLIKSILKCLVLGGVLGPAKAYFGTVENQGRGSLHLHLLIWLNHDFTPAQLKEKIQDEDFRQNLLRYLEDIVKEDLDQFRDIDESRADNAATNELSMEEMQSAAQEFIPACLSTPNPDQVDFPQAFRKDVVRIVESSNIHKHSTTCYKYAKAKSNSVKACRMRMPRALVQASNIDVSTGQITMRRSHPWINNFNEWIISACRSNMDIKFIWTGSDAKALVYYITDYVTKSNLAFYDMYTLAQQGIQSLERQEHSNTTDTVVEKSRKLILRCYNMIASHQEVSGVQVASYLMNYGDHYTTHSFRNLFLFSIESYIQTALIKARQTEKYIQDDPDEISCTSSDDQDEEIKEDEEQFLLEPTQTYDDNRFIMVNTRLDYQYRSKDLSNICLYDFVSYFHKKQIDKSDRRVLKTSSTTEGQRLHIEGTRLNERHTFASAHPQYSTHLIIKHTTPVVPVLLGPQIPRHDREETRERYCRAVLTLFVPWRSVHDLCTLSETWSEAFEVRKASISSRSLKIIENIQLLHECKSDRDEHLQQVIMEAQSDSKIDPFLTHNACEEDENNSEDNPEELLHMISLVNETTTQCYSASLNSNEQRYLHDTLEAIDRTKRFASLNNYRNVLNRNVCYFEDDSNTFLQANSDHVAMIKGWKREMELKRDQARNYLISGEDTPEMIDHEPQVELVTSEIPTSPIKVQSTSIPPVITTSTAALPTKSDIVKKFTLNKQQIFAFMIITSHLDGDNDWQQGTIDRQLLMCVPGCGGTGKSQLIRAITSYFQLTKRGKMLRKLAPTSMAAAEIDGLTIHSFLGEGRKSSRKKPTRTFRPGDIKLENEWRHIKYLIIDEMSMVGLSLLARLNRIVKTAKHNSTDTPFAGINVIFFGDYLQYSPVLDKPLYYNGLSSQQYTERQIEIHCAQKIVAQINCVVELNQQMRTEDVRYLQLLNRLRDGKSTMEDYELLCTRIIGSPDLHESLEQNPWNEAPILVFRNTVRTQINNRAVLNKAIQMGIRPTVCVAQDYIKNSPITDRKLRKAILELSDNKTEHLPGYLPLISGMPVLLTENTATELGLSNGSRGIFRQLVYEDNTDEVPFDETVFPKHTKFVAHPKYALVEFTSCKLETGLQELQSKIIPIAVTEQTFLFDIKELLNETTLKAAKITNRGTKISIKRKALPLIPAYSLTTHKCQGQTMPKIIVDLVTPPGHIEVASIYVPLSRVKRLNDLLILRPFLFSTLQVKPSAAQVQELNRLQKIEQETRKQFHSIL